MRDLGHLEAAIMDRVWAIGAPVTVRAITDELRGERPLAYTTVMTVMNNLHRKGLLDRDMAGRAWVYTARRSQAEHTALLLQQVLDASRERGPALLHFVEHLPHDEAEHLRAALAERREDEPR